MGEKIREISDRTLLPISLVVVLISCGIYISGVSSDAKEAWTLAQECQSDFKKIDERLSRIEGLLKVNLNKEDK